MWRTEETLQLHSQWKINFVMPYFWDISRIMVHYGRYQNRAPWIMLKMDSLEFHHILLVELICYKTRNKGANFTAFENGWPILSLLQFLLLLWPPSQFQTSVHFPLLFTMLQRIHRKRCHGRTEVKVLKKNKKTSEANEEAKKIFFELLESFESFVQNGKAA